LAVELPVGISVKFDPAEYVDELLGGGYVRGYLDRYRE
jgi:hypothetical protein